MSRLCMYVRQDLPKKWKRQKPSKGQCAESDSNKIIQVTSDCGIYVFTIDDWTDREKVIKKENFIVFKAVNMDEQVIIEQNI